VTLWIVSALLTLLLLFILLRPLVVRRGTVTARAAFDLEVYRDQLKEIDRDVARGLIGAEEAEAARLEVQRRILAADQAAGSEQEDRSAPLSTGSVLLLALLVPAIAGSVYLIDGRPDLPGRPFAADEPEPKDPAAATRLAALRESAGKNPGSAAAWERLARFNYEQRRFRSAARAYGRAYKLSGNRPALASIYAEALVRVRNGIVTDEAQALFAVAAKANPRDARARFFLGLAEAQRNRPKAALERWARLELDAPAGAPWLTILRREMARVADAAKIDLAAIRAAAARAAGRSPSTAPRGPTKDDIDNARRMTPEQRMQMIRGMVAGLEARLKEKPDDLAGWQRLGRSYQVLGDREKSAWAYGKAAALAPKDRKVVTDYAAARLRLQKPGTKLDAETVAVLQRLLALDENHALALFYLGVAAADAGRTLEARLYWEKLLKRLPAGSPLRARLEAQLERMRQQLKQ